jgi:hypothetical protein
MQIWIAASMKRAIAILFIIVLCTLLKAILFLVLQFCSNGSERIGLMGQTSATNSKNFSYKYFVLDVSIT